MHSANGEGPWRGDDERTGLVLPKELADDALVDVRSTLDTKALR